MRGSEPSHTPWKGGQAQDQCSSFPLSRRTPPGSASTHKVPRTCPLSTESHGPATQNVLFLTASPSPTGGGEGPWTRGRLPLSHIRLLDSLSTFQKPGTAAPPCTAQMGSAAEKTAPCLGPTEGWPWPPPRPPLLGRRQIPEHVGRGGGGAWREAPKTAAGTGQFGLRSCLPGL